MGVGRRFSEAQQVCFCFGETVEGPAPAVIHAFFGKSALCPFIVALQVIGPFTRKNAGFVIFQPSYAV